MDGERETYSKFKPANCSDCGVAFLRTGGIRR